VNDCVGFASNLSMEDKRSGMILGLSVSSGIARGTAHVIQDTGRILIPRRTIKDGDIGGEMAKFDAATREAEQGLLRLQKDVRQKIGKRDAEIFDAQILLVHDASLRKEVASRCQVQKINIEAALAEAIEKFAGMFVQLEDPHFREKSSDIRDIGKRLLDILLKRQHEEILSPPEGAIIVATELLPSTTARMNLKLVRGLVLEGGAQTSHAAILTRSLGIPSVVHVTNALTRIKTNDQLLVDGLAGRVFINPSKSILKEYEKLQKEFEAHQSALQDEVALPATTLDGVAIKISANIGKSADAEAAFRFRAEGIGLYRTEFNFSGAGLVSERGGTISVLQNRGGAHDTGRSRDSSLGCGRRQDAALFPTARRNQPVLGLPGNPPLVETSSYLQNATPRHPSCERFSSRIHPFADDL